MRLASICHDNHEQVAVLVPTSDHAIGTEDGDYQLVLMETINAHLSTDGLRAANSAANPAASSGTNAATAQAPYPTDMLALLEANVLPELTVWYNAEGLARLRAMPALDPATVQWAPLVRHPRKIFGIGLNYRDHAADLAEQAPQGSPASFFKPATTIIGPGQPIVIPPQSQATTAEAELGIIMGAYARNLDEANWLDAVAGFTTIIDMTAEDILRENPRYLTRAKSFDTFLSLGAILVTPDEITDIAALTVKTVHNEAVHAQNTVSNMTFSPAHLVAFHSHVMPWEPGDILSTGTPRAVHIAPGDTVACHIDGFTPLVNPVHTP